MDGTHYARTANHWLENHDGAGEEALAIMRRAYGDDRAALWNQRWRMFWMACAEMFGMYGGKEWLVAHYRFQRADAADQPPSGLRDASLVRAPLS